MHKTTSKSEVEERGREVVRGMVERITKREEEDRRREVIYQLIEKETKSEVEKGWGEVCGYHGVVEGVVKNKMGEGRRERGRKNRRKRGRKERGGGKGGKEGLVEVEAKREVGGRGRNVIKRVVYNQFLGCKRGHSTTFLQPIKKSIRFLLLFLLSFLFLYPSFPPL